MSSIKHRITDFAATVLRRPVLWLIDWYVEAQRRNLEYYQAKRAEAQSEGARQRWHRLAENARNTINEWDRIKADPKSDPSLREKKTPPQHGRDGD
jgi:hypothetical protein